MTPIDLTIRPARLTVLAFAAAGALLAGSAARAQPYDDYDYDSGPSTVGELTVTAPYTVGRSAIGAPIQEVRASRIVEFRDLDLDTAWGAHALRARIRYAARSACEELDARYPVTVDDPSNCYQNAVRTGFQRAAYVTGYRIADY